MAPSSRLRACRATAGSRPWRRALHAALVLLVLLLVSVAASAEPVDMEVFTRSGCPRCQAAAVFLEQLRAELPELRILLRHVDREPEALSRLKELTKNAGVQTPGVPAFFVRGQLVVGFQDQSTTGAQLRALVMGERTDMRQGAACATESETPCDEAAVDEAVETPLFGKVSVARLGLPLFTIVLGLLDGFNPCAMWVLLFILAMLVNLHDRSKMALIAATFVLVSGAVYFAFMAAWLNFFMLVGMSDAVRVTLGLLALLVGAINVKDFFAFKAGPSLSIADSAKPGIYARARRVLYAENLAAALVATAVLALLVNVVELLCTAGLPAVYTAILSRQELSTAGHYGYLALYNLAYIADDSLMVAIAVITLGRRKLQEKQGRWLKLVSGAVMLALALGLLAFPRLLAV